MLFFCIFALNLYPKHKYKVEVFALCYNEEYIIQSFIDHYKKNFDAKIRFFDNESTDNSITIMANNNCDFTTFTTNNEIDENAYLRIKNNCWKSSEADFVIVCDMDEFLEVKFDIEASTIIKTWGIDIIGDLDSRLGAHNSQYNKSIMFSPKHIREINYNAGCHTCNPIGKIVYSDMPSLLLHRKYISEDYVIKKHKEYTKRNSPNNKLHGYASHYEQNTEKEVKDLFANLRQNAIII